MNLLLSPRFAILLIALAANLSAEVSVPSIFSDNMVLQRNRKNPVWGAADPGERITVRIGDQSKTTTADATGKWQVVLEPMAAGGPFDLIIKGGNTIKISNILVGEVWVCSGQSNMEWSVANSNNDDVEIASANNDRIRFITVPKKGTQVPQDDFEGGWEVCSPESVQDFSAIGHFFGRRIEQTLGVPVGLIDNSWGGSAAEAWVPREVFEADPELAPILKKWDGWIADFSDEHLQELKAKHEIEVAEWEANGREGRRPRPPQDIRIGQHRPANIYNGGVLPILGYGIRGIIWYQGESNAGRAAQYHTLFPAMIENMREQWGQGDFPFYWVQLADFRDETDEPVQDSNWALLREAQTATMGLCAERGTGGHHRCGRRT